MDQLISAPAVVCQKFDMSIIKVFDFFEWAPRNVAQAPNFLFQGPEGLPKNSQAETLALITQEQVNTSVVDRKKILNEQNFAGEANWLGVVNFHCMQRSLVMSMRFICSTD